MFQSLLVIQNKTCVTECSAHTVPLQRFLVTVTRAGGVLVADNKSVFTLSVFQVWRLELLFLVVSKTFYNNGYLKQHKCNPIWV